MNKSHLTHLQFKPSEGKSDIYTRSIKGYTISASEKGIDYGEKIKVDNTVTQNLNKAENYVVLECVCRLLEQGYKPESITLEKTWPSGHGKSARLDIAVHREDGTEYLLIECKTWGAEYEKALTKLKSNGGQLFTYFKFTGNKPDVIMLYTSQITAAGVAYRNDIIRIEPIHREGDASDFYKSWNKLTSDNGIFEAGVAPYQFKNKYLTLADLAEISHADSSLIFNQFLEILRHNVVSDKPNAFNKIFSLFLCKVRDEKATSAGEPLRFQWREGEDDDVSFQIRLTDLYQEGMKDFLNKEVTDISEDYLRKEFGDIKDINKLLRDVRKLRLEKNNEFAIKEVFDHPSFQENAIVVKEVVQLLQKFRIRYNKRQQYLSDFFEQLLTTGLKQESGQFFTPVPIAQFIIKSLPVLEIAQEKLLTGRREELLPYVMDYAVGSGHFLTEMMHELQRFIDGVDAEQYIADTGKYLKSWKENHFDWAEKYMYGVEKDYRLVKVGKVGCYLHGDGLANIVHSDGLGSFTKTPTFQGKLKHSQADNPRENRQFDIVVSNPPYSVEAFKSNAKQYYGAEDFTLYHAISDDSSAIECLFIERSAQLLKTGGVAGVILPRSILSNGGVYEKARSIILQQFDVLALAELGSNTFMATGTNTVVLFLRRRDNRIFPRIQNAVKKFLVDGNGQEVTIHGIEKPVTAYLAAVWNGLALSDYASILNGVPSEAAQKHPLYKWHDKAIRSDANKAYAKKLNNSKLSDEERAKAHAELEANVKARWQAIEGEKLAYFIISYAQQIVIVRSGGKDAEKAFLGYYFSDRRGQEGIHPMRGKHIDECTKLFHPDVFDHPERASTYVLQAFQGNFSSEIHESLREHVSRSTLAAQIDFERTTFEKTINLTVKKKVSETRHSQYPMVKLGDVIEISRGASPRPIKHYLSQSGVNWIKIGDVSVGEKYITTTKEKITAEGASLSKTVKKGDFIVSNSMSVGRPYILGIDGAVHDGWLVLSNYQDTFSSDFLYAVLSSSEVQKQFSSQALGGVVENLNTTRVKSVSVPLPPLEQQQKIVAAIAELESQEAEQQKRVAEAKAKVSDILQKQIVQGQWEQVKLGDVCTINELSGNPINLFGVDAEFNYIDISAVDNGSINKSGIKKIPSASAPSRARKIPRLGDILLSTVRPNLKAFALVKELPDNPIASTGFAVITPQKINPVFLHHLLLTDSLVEQMVTKMDKGAYPSINEQDVKNLQIALPPLEQQQEIVAAIEAVDSLRVAAEKQLLTLAQRKKQVFDEAVYERVQHA